MANNQLSGWMGFSLANNLIRNIAASMVLYQVCDAHQTCQSLGAVLMHCLLICYDSCDVADAQINCYCAYMLMKTNNGPWIRKTQNDSP